MLRRLPFSAAARGLLGLSCIALLFHALIVTGVVPYENVWGGRLQSREQMLVFESGSVLLNLLMMFAVAARAGFLRVGLAQRWLAVACWVFSGIFALNTLGNMAATTTFEMLVFTPLTLAACLAFARLAMGSEGAT